jgi:hypothetical protein
MQSIKRFLTGMVREMAPPVLFFFIAFLLMGLMFKLFVSQYEIEFSAFAKAAIAALIIGKVIALMDLAESRSAADRNHRRIVVVALKTLLYALVVIVLGIGEKIFHAYREAGSLGEAVSNLIANANFDHFMGLVLLISLVVFFYLAMQEIEEAMGEGAMYRLFFKRPDPNPIPEGRVSRTR